MPVVQLRVPSRLQGEDLRATALPPPNGAVGLPWLYLLHGRGSTLDAMEPVLLALDRAMDDGTLDRHVVIAPDAPWVDRASWWVDSAYGGDPTGPFVESAMLTELLPEVERRWGEPACRVIGGISMGAAAALRWAIVHPALFGAAVLLSPAVYASLPPTASSVRESTAFGAGTVPYTLDRWLELCHYPSLLARRTADSPRLRVVTVVGDGEPAHDDPTGWWCDLDLEAARLHAALRRAPAADSVLRVVGGGHSWDLWEREIVPALQLGGECAPLRVGPGG